MPCCPKVQRQPDQKVATIGLHSDLVATTGAVGQAVILAATIDEAENQDFSHAIVIEKNPISSGFYYITHLTHLFFEPVRWTQGEKNKILLFFE